MMTTGEKIQPLVPYIICRLLVLLARCVSCAGFYFLLLAFACRLSFVSCHLSLVACCFPHNAALHFETGKPRWPVLRPCTYHHPLRAQVTEEYRSRQSMELEAEESAEQQDFAAVREWAAVTIQRTWRGYQCRKALATQRELDAIAAEVAVSNAKAKELEERHTAALLIQSHWRRYVAQKELRHRLDLEHRVQRQLVEEVTCSPTLVPACTLASASCAPLPPLLPLPRATPMTRSSCGPIKKHTQSSHNGTVAFTMGCAPSYVMPIFTPRILCSGRCLLKFFAPPLPPSTLCR